VALPAFNVTGDLPEGIHHASLSEILRRFGTGTTQRQSATASLLRIHSLAQATGKLDRMIIFGSYVTERPTPNDVDIILVMRDDFDMRTCDQATQLLFDHRQAARVFGASVFWIRPAMLVTESLDSFVAHWQIKRDGTRRGIVEVGV
jgi:predicted nucleotidyltransferase